MNNLSSARPGGPAQEDLLALYHISQVINSILDLEELLNRVMDLVIERTKAERGFVVLKDETRQELKVKAARNFERQTIEDPTEISYTIVHKVINEANPILTSDAKTDPRFAGSESVFLYHILSILCVPLIKREKIIGVIYIDSRTITNVFSERDLNFLIAFANLAAIAIDNALLQEKLKSENIALKEEIKGKYRFENIIGRGKKIQEVLEIVERVIESSVPVLLEGESGTGKELIARAIHFNGPRSEKKFVAQYCGALPETLLEAELFGYKKGSFTGASSDKPGLFEVADGGTFFLDEVGEISPSIQTKLLRVLQDGEIRRIGETEPRKVDVRIISATNRNLESEVKEGKFREDLFYRLKVVGIRLPPLRERKEDIPILVQHFLKKTQVFTPKGIKGIEEKAIDALLHYNWPGNIRELENVISYVIVMAKGEIISLSDLPSEIIEQKKEVGPRFVRKTKSLKEAEKEIILTAFREAGGDRKKAAKKLGISLRTLQYKLKEYGE
ncbi:MAG: sigma 54-interacting transcriptional regulator [Candidatus Edwardsbacteria bacterium]